MNNLHTMIERVDKVVSTAVVALLALLVVDVVWQVLTRFIFEKPSSFTEEVARFILIWLSLFGAASAYHRGLHLGIDVLVNKFAGATRFIAEMLVHFAAVLFSLSILIYGGGKLVALTFSLQQTSAVLGVKMGWIYLAMPLSGLVFLLYSIGFMFRSIDQYRMNSQPSSDKHQISSDKHKER